MAESEEARPYQGLNMLHNINSPTGVKGNVGKTKSSPLENFPPKESECKKKVSKSTQVNSTWITEEDISSDFPSEHFWANVAEMRRVALDEALRVNERLCNIYQSLIIQNETYKHMLEELNSFVDVVKDLILEDADDTGMDLEDFNDLNDSAGSVNAEDI